MDSTIIEEIAKQLGIAVDQTGQFITDYLPQYAALRAMQIVTPFCIVAVFFAVAIAVAAISFIVARKAFKERKQAWGDMPDKSRMWCPCPSFCDSISGKCAVVSAVIGAVLFTLAFIAAIFCAGDIIGWSNYPEAMLIDMALKAVS